VLLKEGKIFFRKYHSIAMPGYTHMQKAMPMNLGVWVESFISGLEDDLQTLGSVLRLVDQSPLGSAAGFGSPLTLDRKLTAQLLGFSKVQENPLYCQNSRGKFEATILSVLISILLTLNKFASDVLLFTTSEFGFFDVNNAVSTGSSFMPQKKNIDIAELIRSKVHIVLGNYVSIVSVSSNLMSGYNRDLQDSKKPLMESFEITHQTLQVSILLFQSLNPNTKKLKLSMTPELFATEKALKLVKKGVPFRDAYLQVKQRLRRS
jgi:argininosuccinate lyase